mgnify:CR=1 FL=1
MVSGNFFRFKLVFIHSWSFHGVRFSHSLFNLRLYQRFFLWPACISFAPAL